MTSMIISLQILPVVFTLLVMVVLSEAGLRHGFQGLDSAHGGMEADIADLEDFHHLLSKRSPFFFKLMKFAKKKLNPLTLP